MFPTCHHPGRAQKGIQTDEVTVRAGEELERALHLALGCIDLLRRRCLQARQTEDLLGGVQQRAAVLVHPQQADVPAGIGQAPVRGALRVGHLRFPVFRAQSLRVGAHGRRHGPGGNAEHCFGVPAMACWPMSSPTS